MELREEVQKYYDLAKASRVARNLKIVLDDQFSFTHSEDRQKVTIYFNLNSEVVTIIQQSLINGNSEDDDISLEGFAKYVGVITVEQGIEIQTEQLANLKTVLKKKVFKALVEHATKDNDKAKTGLNIVRGDDLVYFVKRVAIGDIKID